jgi:hypothetical protein
VGYAKMVTEGELIGMHTEYSFSQLVSNILKRRKETRDRESSDISPAQVASTSAAQSILGTRMQAETEFKIPLQPRDTSFLSRVCAGEYNTFSRCKKSWGVRGVEILQAYTSLTSN